MFTLTIPKASTPIEVNAKAVNLDICTLPTPTLPNGFQVMLLGSGGSAVESYGYDNGSWVNEGTFETVTSTALTGTVLFRNPASYDIGITW